MDKRVVSSACITPTGHRILTAELKWLWKHKRPYATRKVKEAAALGDRSENADYHYNKRLLREIDQRIAYLSRRLDQLYIVSRPPRQQSRVFFGAWVVLVRDRDSGREAREYRIVGTDEIDFAAHYISIDAPLVRRLIGKHSGDEVLLAGAHGDSHWQILRIRYADDGDDPSLDVTQLLDRFQQFPMQL